MRRSRAQTAETRRSAVAAAARLSRERGLEGVGVADVMQAIGHTAGGFYRHFESKEALLAEACAKTFEDFHDAQKTVYGPAPANIQDVVSRYLSRLHRDTPATGCPVPALASDVRYHSEDVRSVFTDALKQRLETLNKINPGNEGANVAALGGMIGALALSRAVSDPAFSDKLLSDTLDYWLGTFATAADTGAG